VLAVTGNHEYASGTPAAYVERWRSLGITPLLNASTTLERGGEDIAVAGLTDVDGTGDAAPDPDAALAGIDPGTFTVLLAHEPRQVLGGRGVDLQLSGHTHGGQLWPLGYLVPLQQPTLAGVDVVDGVTVVTSRGVGTALPPVRVGAPPEVVVVTLRRAG
jgi:predicted MPP superfamily phosphohydrolase